VKISEQSRDFRRLPRNLTHREIFPQIRNVRPAKARPDRRYGDQVRIQIN
jgi:hypothetical protein